MLAKRLRIALDRKGIKQSVLAYRVGVDRSYISNYLSGKYKPSAEIHNKIAEVLGVSSAWLSGFDVPMVEMPEATEPVHDLSESERLMIALMRQLPPESQEKAIPLIEAALRAVGLLE